MFYPLIYNDIQYIDGRAIFEYMKKPSPTTLHVLKALVPYTSENIELAYKPSLFFNKLEKISKTKERTLRSAFYRSVKKGLVEIDDTGIPHLTTEGHTQMKLYEPTVLGKDSYLFVTFDIPESERYKRTHLRNLLRELEFKMIQQSVWACRYDHRDYIASEIADYGLEEYVHVYEAVRIRV
jgi:hypothetical protein